MWKLKNHFDQITYTYYGLRFNLDIDYWETEPLVENIQFGRSDLEMLDIPIPIPKREWFLRGSNLDYYWPIVMNSMIISGDFLGYFSWTKNMGVIDATKHLGKFRLMESISYFFFLMKDPFLKVIENPRNFRTFKLLRLNESYIRSFCSQNYKTITSLLSVFDEFRFNSDDEILNISIANKVFTI
jgi:hypothetical protein